MTTLRAVRYVLWALVAVVLAGLGWLSTQNRSTSSITELASVRLGAPFALVDHTGAAITEAAFAGKPTALFFGFTHCPEICPTTLFELSNWIETLGDDANGLHGYFVTVDPERDTPELLGDYISSFEGRVTGITGEPDKVLALADAWRVYHKKVPLDDGGYTMDHTASIFLIRPDGTLQGTIAFNENPDVALEKLKRLAAS